MSDDVPIRPAATIALLRDQPDGPEVFMLRRHSNHVFAARAYVYPGGALEAEDHAAGLLARYGADDAAFADAAMGMGEALGYWSAAIRECFEESGVLVGCDIGKPLAPEAQAAARDELNAGVLGWRDLVAKLELRFDATTLQYFAHWTTPQGMPRRFSTRFFAARMPPGQQANPDGSETTRGEWLRPEAALDRQRAGEIFLMTPTIATLRQLGEYADIDSALADMSAREVVAR